MGEKCWIHTSIRIGLGELMACKTWSAMRISVKKNQTISKVGYILGGPIQEAAHKQCPPQFFVNRHKKNELPSVLLESILSSNHIF